MNQHTYISNTFTEEQIGVMENNNNNSNKISNFLSLEEFKTIQSILNNITEWPEVGKTSKYNGMSYTDGIIGHTLKRILDSKIQNWIGKYELDFFAFQEAILPWKIHADLRWYANKIPGKAILIPLDVISESSSIGWKDTYTITFQQRNYKRKVSIKNKGESRAGNSDQKTWKRPIDDPSIELINPGYHIDKHQYKKYFSHMDYEWLEGLEIDACHRWDPCSAFVWDQCALHCADNFLDKSIKTKKSLILFTNYIT